MLLSLASTHTSIGRGIPARVLEWCSLIRPSLLFTFRALIASVIAIVLFVTPLAHAQGPWVQDKKKPFGSEVSERSTLIQARPAYMWGYNEIWFRDGDNSNIRPSKKEVTLNSPTLAIEVEKSIMSDLAVRLQGSCNLPTNHRTDFLFDRPDQQPQTDLSWDTRGRFLFVDLSLVYLLGLDDSPLRAGFVTGYRYHDFTYDSTRAQYPPGIFEDRIQVHVPYTGVYYEDRSFMKSNVRLDLTWSALTLTTLESERTMLGSLMRIDGHAVTGLWLEAYFAWTAPIIRGFSMGAFARYNFIELSGGATIKNGLVSTRFSMDSRHHVVLTGLTLIYGF